MTKKSFKYGDIKPNSQKFAILDVWTRFFAYIAKIFFNLTEGRGGEESSWGILRFSRGILTVKVSLNFLRRGFFKWFLLLDYPVYTAECADPLIYLGEYVRQNFGDKFTAFGII